MIKSDRVTRIAYVVEAAFEYFISMFVTGTMLSYILDTIGFSDAVQGIICTVASFACVSQLFAFVTFGKRVKRFVTVGHIINQFCFVLVYLLPISGVTYKLKAILLICLLFIGHIINNAVQPSMITWYMAAVPNEQRGRFTALKEMISLAGGIVVSFAFGRVADIYRNAEGMPTRPYYAICAATLFIMMLIHTVSHVVTEEKPPVKDDSMSLEKSFYKLMGNKSFIKITVADLLWNATSALSIPFLASYAREELSFSFTAISLFTILGSVSRIMLSPLLGKIADKYSFASSMTLSFILAGLGFIAIVFTTPKTRWLYVVYSCLNGFAMAGINSGVINLVYDYVKPAERTTAIGTKNAICGIFSFLVALLSGAILSKIQESGGSVLLGFNMYAQQFLSLLSLLITLLTILYMQTVIISMQRVFDKDGSICKQKFKTNKI